MPLCRAGEPSQLWKQGGLENVQEQALDITMKFDSFADYWEPFLLGQGPAGAYLRTLQDARLQLLRSALKRRLSIHSESHAFLSSRTCVGGEGNRSRSPITIALRSKIPPAQTDGRSQIDGNVSLHALQDEG